MKSLLSLVILLCIYSCLQTMELDIKKSLPVLVANDSTTNANIELKNFCATKNIKSSSRSSDLEEIELYLHDANPSVRIYKGSIQVIQNFFIELSLVENMLNKEAYIQGFNGKTTLIKEINSSSILIVYLNEKLKNIQFFVAP